MFFSLERMVAIRYLRAKRKDGAVSVVAGLSLVGIALGVATLIVVMAVMNGFRQELLDRIIGINGHVSMHNYSEGIPDYNDLVTQLQAVDRVKKVIPYIDGQVMATYKNYASGVLVKGLNYEDVLKKPLLVESMMDGAITALEKPKHVLLGKRLGEMMGVSIGDTISLLSPKGFTTVVGMVPRVGYFVVGGFFEVGMYEYDSTTIIMPLLDAQRYFRLKDKVNMVEIFADNADNAPALANQILYEFKGEYYVTDWQATNAHFFNALDTERVVMFFILTLIIAVAAFNIFSSQIMLVKEKAGNIAIMRTMGATRSSIMCIFILSGFAIGIIGSVAGVVLGVAFASNIAVIQSLIESLTGAELFDPVIYFLSELPAIVNPAEVMVVFVIALVLSFLATLIPAYKASKQLPAEILRYE